MRIAIIGLGYVGTANAILLAQNNDVIGFDICKDKVIALNKNKSPIRDRKIDDYLSSIKLSLKATLSEKEAICNANCIFIAVPTIYDTKSNELNTKIIENTIKQILKLNPYALIVIKSTVPIGFTEGIRKLYKSNNIIYSPEFLREKNCLQDILEPSRIIIGDKSPKGKQVAHLLVNGIKKSNTPVVFTNPSEAEAIKLFSNAYLAMRISFFNEIDSYARLKGLSTTDIITGVCLDNRIGDYYNVPSYGYGGHCLPKDTKQLLANFKGVPQSIISGIVNANGKRIEALKKKQSWNKL